MGTPRSNVKLGEVMATRTLRMPTGKTTVIRFGKPRRTRRDWLCPYAIGRGEDSLRVAYGVDAVQALYNALEAVRTTLERTGPGGKWIGGGSATDHGFQRVVGLALGPAFSSRVSAWIDAEERAFAKRAESLTRKRRGARGGEP